MSSWLWLHIDFIFVCLSHKPHDCSKWDVNPGMGGDPPSWSPPSPFFFLCAPLCAHPTPAFGHEGNGSTRRQTSIPYVFITFPNSPLLPPTYADPLVHFPACFLTLVPSPWPPPGPWSTCLRAPPPAPHYHMNAGREGPAEAWTPTEGDGFAIHSSSTSSHSLYTGTGTVTSMIEDGERDRCAFTRSCHACACIYMHACAQCVSVCKSKDDVASGDD